MSMLLDIDETTLSYRFDLHSIDSILKEQAYHLTRNLYEESKIQTPRRISSGLSATNIWLEIFWNWQRIQNFGIDYLDSSEAASRPRLH